MDDVRIVRVLYDPSKGLKVETENCPAFTAEMMLLSAVATIQRELLAARIGAASPSGLVVARDLPPLV